MSPSALFAAAALCLAVASCSLNYSGSVSSKDAYPELELENVDYKRYEDGALSVEVTADKVEQYADTGEAYASNAHFKTWNSEGEAASEGSADLLSADTQNELYTFAGDIQIENTEQDFSLSAEALRWNNNTKRLSGGRDETVTVERGDTRLSGRGFSADGNTSEFSFESDVGGEIITEDDGAER